MLTSSPAAGVKLPRLDRPTVQPLELDQVLALAEAMPARARAAMLFAAGSGLRMGEALGLTVDRVDFLRRTVRVDRQIITPARGEPHFGPPKTPSSRRTVPLAQVTLDVLAAHLAQFPAVDGLVFTSSHRQPWRRGTFAELIPPSPRGRRPTGNGDVPRLEAPLRLGADRRRVFDKAVQSALGHKNASETLDTYSHLWPADEDRLRNAVQALHGPSRVTHVSRGVGATL